MAHNIYRRDTRQNLLDLIPSRHEIVTIEDDTKHGFMEFGQLRTIAQLLERDGGIEVRDWDTNHGKGNTGLNALDLSTSISLFGGGALGDYSFAIGLDSSASGIGSEASGKSTVASGDYSTAKGNQTVSSGFSSHAEGAETSASGDYSHSEGRGTTASGESSHAEGASCQSIGHNSHSEGNKTIANGDNSHSSGLGTIADNENETVVGSYNDNSRTDGIFTVGVGDYDSNSDTENRLNAFEVDKDGSIRATLLTKDKIDTSRSLVTKEFIQDKLALENWNNDFDIPDGVVTPLFSSTIPETDTHANISAVFVGGILLRPSKYTLLNSGGFKSVQIHASVTLNESDWISLQNTRVFIQD